MTRCATRRAAAPMLLALSLAVPSPGQETAPPAAPAENAPAPAPTPTPTPRPARRVAAPTLAVGVGGPLLASASAGVILGKDHSLPDECPSPRGWLVQGEAGVGGAKISAGPIFTYCYTSFGSLGAGSLQATYVRTWGNPLGTEPRLSYVGGELDIGLIDWKITLGLLKRTGGGDTGANFLFTWGLARGF